MVDSENVFSILAAKTGLLLSWQHIENHNLKEY